VPAKRIVPCLDVTGGRVVKGVRFVDLKDAGDPAELASAYDRAGADEIVFLDITATSDERAILLDVVARTADQVFIPLTVGGGVRTVEDMQELLSHGADKVSVNSSALADPTLMTRCAEVFGSQCVVLAVDARRAGGAWEVYVRGGRHRRAREEGHDPPGHRGAEDDLTQARRADCLEQLVAIGAFEQVAARPGAHRGEDRIVVVQHREHQDRQPRSILEDSPRRLHAAHAGQPEIHQHEIGPEPPHHLDRVLSGRGLAHGLGLSGVGQHQAQAVAVHRVVVDDHDSQRSPGGRRPTGRDAVEWAAEGARLGAGEILLTSMDRDGTQDGYDLELTAAVSGAVRLPVIASGGAGKVEHLHQALTTGGAEAALAASIFHFGELTIARVKRELAARGIEMRPAGGDGEW